MQDGGKVWGRVEVKHLNVWGHICDHTWTDKSANVACKHMGFKGGVAFGTKYTPKKVAWVSYIICNGSEDRLDQCNFGTSARWQPDFHCPAASVLCYNTSGTIMNVVKKQSIATSRSSQFLLVSGDECPGS